MSKNQEYAQQYAELAMEQQRRYGIPASVILAQGILESSNGQSELSRKGNNHFGIKATKGWLEDGGSYLIFKDDKPGEKFCSYESVSDSYEHHSKFLKENARYADCFKLESDDWQGWAEGLQKAGYATGSGYADKLKSIIERNGLDKYDRMAMQQTEVQTIEKLKDQETEKKETASQKPEETGLLPQQPGISMGGDPIVELMVTLYTGLMALAMQIDGKDKVQMEEENKRIDITSLAPGMSKCVLDASDPEKARLDVTIKDISFSHILTPAETARISQIIRNDGISIDQQRDRLASVLNMAVMKDYASQCFEQEMSEDRSIGMHR